MTNNHYKHKDYSNLLKELQKKSKTNNTDATKQSEESTNNVDPPTIEKVSNTLDYEKSVNIEYDLDILLSSVKDLSELITLYDMCNEQVEREQQITQDLLHAIEFSNNCKERYRYSTQLCYNRRRRRQYKNAVAVLKPIVDFIKKEENKKMLNRLSNVLGEARKAKSHENEKSYSPRILTELGVIVNGNKDN